MFTFICFLLAFLQPRTVFSYIPDCSRVMENVFSWKQIGYNIDGVLSHGWSYDETIHEDPIKEEKGTCLSRATVADWHNYCREVIVLYHIDKQDNLGKIGGPGKVVQIDESKFGKRKYNRDTNDTNLEKKIDTIHFEDEIDEREKFFIQYNNVPIGMEVHKDLVFVTVPRRRYGIPSTLNFVRRTHKSPHLKPYPNGKSLGDFISVYRPKVDSCGRLWMVDTGMLEIPDARRQIRPPQIIVYDLKTDEQILKYQLKATDLVDERTPAGLTSITVEVSPEDCADAYAYINDLATNGVIVFSLKKRDSIRVSHPSFVHNPDALNFTVAGNVINWKDGIFSTTILERFEDRIPKAILYHPLVSTEEFLVDADVFKNGGNINDYVRRLGSRGGNTQSGSHAFDPSTRVVLFANVAQDAILCWHIDTTMSPENVQIVVQDHRKLVYISDLKISEGYVWVLVNQIPNFVYSRLNPKEYNYYIHKGNVLNLIKGSVCDKGT